MRTAALLSASLLAILCVFFFTSHQTKAASGKRVVVLGFDGMDFDLANKYMDEGKLPNLARLRDEYHLYPLRSTTPPESPVAWSAFITGTNPGKTGMFDFLRRNPETYFPELNMTDITKPAQFLYETVPIGAPVLRNARQGYAFWDYAGEAGFKTIGVMMPMNMPPDEAVDTRVLSGLGVPDIRRTMGTYVFYVDDIDVARRKTGSTGGTEMGGEVIQVVREGDEVQTYLPGPFSPLPSQKDTKLRAEVTMTVDPQAKSVDFRVFNKKAFQFLLFFKGLTISLICFVILWVLLARFMKGSLKGFIPAFVLLILAIAILGYFSRKSESVFSTVVKEGEWSEWVPVSYLVTDWVSVGGFFRMYLIEGAPEFQMYVTPVNIDPRETKSAAISFPADFAPHLLNRYGDFKTYGWDSETWALNENVLDDQVFLDDLLANWDLKADMVYDLMRTEDWTLFSAVFQGTDHVSHMFWRFIDKTHPMYDPAMDELYGDSVLKVYQRGDALVGRVMDGILDDDDELIVLSDHGFQTWKKAVNLNKWLVDEGYLAEKKSVLGGPSSVYELFSKGSEFFQWVDWSKSKAYALGLGQIYINLQGRESKGIVTENEKSALIDEIVAKLKDMRDPETGEPVLAGVYRADQIYQGDNMKYSPDIVVGFAPGYRVSWQTCLGVAAEDLVEVNMRKWSGDHCSFDPSVVKGVFFTTVPITVDDPNIIDLTPSILSLLGIEKPSRCDGRVIY